MIDRWLHRFGEYLGTTAGFALTMGLTGATGVLNFFATEQATYILSVIAIILPAVILKKDADSAKVARQRDEAMHAKLDGLLEAQTTANKALEGIEDEFPDET